MKVFQPFVDFLKDGRVTWGDGEGEAGVGVHEGQAVVHPAVPGGEGGSPDHAEGRAQEAPGGGAGNEVRLYSCPSLLMA